ncbi:VENN motif pre-toxin domain-containing protein, partial [Conservatibacter flavescens]
KLYDKPVDTLTESEKQHVVFLSQLASGLAAGITGDSTTNAVAGAETGKRAVENNFLSLAEWQTLERLSQKKVLTEDEAQEVVRLMAKDKHSERLLAKYQAQFNGGEALSATEHEHLATWIREYGPLVEQINRLNQPAFSAELRPDYREMIDNATRILNHASRYESQQAASLKTGLELGPGGVGVVKATAEAAAKLGALGVVGEKGKALAEGLARSAEKYPFLTDVAATGIVNTGYQLSQDKPYDPYSLLQAELSTVLTRNRSLSQQVSINIGLSTLSTTNDEDYGWNALGAVSGTLGAHGASKINYGIRSMNQFANPIISNYAGEYFGDSERIKSTINNLKEGYKFE